MKMIEQNSFLKHFIMVVLSLFFLFSFISSESESSPSNQITMWTFLNPNAATSGRNLALNKMINSFEEKTGIKVIVEPQQWDLLSAKFFAAHYAGNAPDIIWVNADDIGPVIKSGALVAFEDLFLDSWSKENREDVGSALWNFGVLDGKHYQIMLSINPLGIIYRDDLLKEKGITVPIKSWEDLIDAAQKLTEKDSQTGMERWGLGMAFGIEKATPMVTPISLLGLQGDIYTKDGKANWANNNGIKSMQLEVDMIRKYQITPETALASTAEGMYNDFSAGKYAMIIGGGVRVAKLRDEVTFDSDSVQLMSYPTWDGKERKQNFIAGWSIGVWSGSKNKEEAGQFVEYMFNKESDKLWVLDGGQVPVRKSTIAELEEFFSQPENDYINVMSKITEAGYMPGAEFSIKGWRIDFNQATQAVLAKGVSIEDALKSAEDEFNKRNTK